MFQSEAKEESGLDVIEMQQVGLLVFQFDDKMHEVLEANVFNVTKFSGEFIETEGFCLTDQSSMLT
jgi:hypothetical protein